MLLSFSFKNFKSFKDETDFNLVGKNPDKKLPENFYKYKKEKILKSALVYGQNASGKTSLFNALFAMKMMVTNRSPLSVDDSIAEITPFLLNDYSRQEGSRFEVELLYKEKKYRFGFEADNTKILKEWLFITKTREVLVYKREGENITINATHFKKGIFLRDSGVIRKNMLLLTQAVSYFNEDGVLKDVHEWFHKKLRFMNAKNSDFYNQVTKRAVRNNNLMQESLNSFLRLADLSIDDVLIMNLTFSDDIKNKMKNEGLSDNDILDLSTEIFMKHQLYNKQYDVIGEAHFNLNEESKGTQQLFAIGGPILESLAQGDVLIVDELNNSLHSLIEEQLVKMFNSGNINTHNAQLIANTHNTNLLNNKLLRRDQIWFTEKNSFHESSLYSLADFHIEHKMNYEDAYLKGKFGGIPSINIFEFLNV